MEALFFHENLLVLGTMPDEIYTNYEDVSEVIYSDWLAWGDVTLLMDNANISSNGNTAWIAAIGSVTFDVPGFFGSAITTDSRDG